MWWLFKRRKFDQAVEREYQQQEDETERLERAADRHRHALRDAFDRIDMVIAEVKRKGGPRGAQ